MLGGVGDDVVDVVISFPPLSRDLTLVFAYEGDILNLL